MALVVVEVGDVTIDGLVTPHGDQPYWAFTDGAGDDDYTSSVYPDDEADPDTTAAATFVAGSTFAVDNTVHLFVLAAEISVG